MAEETGLPTSMEDITDNFGIGVTLKLMQHYGGQDVLFPKKLNEHHEWFNIFGEQTARELCHFLSGAKMYVPSGRRISRRLEIKKLEEAGKRRHEICRMLDLSERHIRRLSNADPPQIPLFPDET